MKNGITVSTMVSTVYMTICITVARSPITDGAIGTPTSAYWSLTINANAQKCTGVHTNTTANSNQAIRLRSPVTAAQPTSGGMAPAAPPMTMFCQVERLSHME